MNKNHILLFLLFFLFLPKLAYSVYFASDTVYLYKNDKRLNDNAIYLASYKSHSEKCPNGVCEIGQQFYPVTIYLPKSNDLLIFADYISQNRYSGDPSDYESRDAWNEQNIENYLEYLDQNSNDSTTFDPGPSDGGEGCGEPGCIGGRIGDHRTYNFDFDTGKNTQTSQSVATAKDYNIYILGIFGIILGAIIILARKSFKKNKRD